MLISIVVAVAENGVIGDGKALLWRLPDDLKYFKAITMGKPIVMGRKTFASIGKPLPGRLNIVVTRSVGLEMAGCVVVASIDAALRAAGAAPEVCIIGGGEIYRQALPLARRIYLTRVHAGLAGAVTFPALAPTEWRETHREAHAADEQHVYPFTFITLDRVTEERKS